MQALNPHTSNASLAYAEVLTLAVPASACLHCSVASSLSSIMLKDTSKLVSPWEDVVFNPLLWTQYPGSSCQPGLAQWWCGRDLSGRLWLQCSPLRSTRRVPLISLLVFGGGEHSDCPHCHAEYPFSFPPVHFAPNLESVSSSMGGGTVGEDLHRLNSYLLPSLPPLPKAGT